MSTPLMASSMKPPVWPRTRIVEYMRSHSRAISAGVPPNGSPSTAGRSSRSTMAQETSGASGACASPQATRPSLAVRRTKAVSKWIG